jgi:hypothetical protein
VRKLLKNPPHPPHPPQHGKLQTPRNGILRDERLEQRIDEAERNLLILHGLICDARERPEGGK